MFPLDENNLEALLQECHGALMTVWNTFRRRLDQRGYATEDILHEVRTRVWLARGQFNGPAEAFCSWSATILRNWCLEKLRLYARWVQFSPDHDLAERGGPSVGEQERRWEAYQLARAQLTPAEEALIEARYEQNPRLTADGVAAWLRDNRPDLWRANEQAWGDKDRRSEECGRAWCRLNEEMEKAYYLLEGGCDGRRPT